MTRSRPDSLSAGQAVVCHFKGIRNSRKPTKSILNSPILSLRSSLILYIFLRVYKPSSVSIVSSYGLDDRAIEVRSPAGAKDFSSSLQIGSGAHPASYTMGTGVLSPGVKRCRGVTLTTHPHLVPRSRMSRSYTTSPPERLHGV
jgi:hypothetical protein